MSGPASAANGITTAELETFLYDEADLLDSWRLEEWVELFLPDGTYEVPTTDAPEGSPSTALHFVAESMTVLRGRVSRLMSADGYAESPHARTRRLVSNVRLLEVDGDSVRLAANFIIARMKNGAQDLFIGHYDHLLKIMDGEFRFQRRRSILDLEALRPQRSVSIII
ncbi:MAG: p-cumate dioxygenase [Alphaproteobacteria bacterium]|nr:p-cumate dioxygenase [Alphaproteobacteria bacterium]|tara:strand:+ start:1472 stop:1975 length:504 start_codon:yes stop_codon:yes gene_type:complete